MSKFNIKDGIEILEKTPGVLQALMVDLSSHWINDKFDEKQWSPFDIVGHLLHGEKSDWISRTQIILKFGEKKIFSPFDRFAQFEDSKGKTMADLLDEFTSLRWQNLERLKALSLDAPELAKTGQHPDFGQVTLQQLLSAWVVHDLGHISQIVRCMAMRYKDDVGPWQAYLKIVGSQES